MNIFTQQDNKKIKFILVKYFFGSRYRNKFIIEISVISTISLLTLCTVTVWFMIFYFGILISKH